MTKQCLSPGVRVFRCFDRFRKSRFSTLYDRNDVFEIVVMIENVFHFYLLKQEFQEFSIIIVAQFDGFFNRFQNYFV